MGAFEADLCLLSSFAKFAGLKNICEISKLKFPLRGHLPAIRKAMLGSAFAVGLTMKIFARCCEPKEAGNSLQHFQYFDLILQKKLCFVG